MKNEKLGFILGLLAVSCFSFTLPMSRLAVQGIDPFIVGFGRAFAASLVAVIVVIVARLPFPTRSDIRPLFLTGLGVTLIFPYFSSLAMKSLPAAHGAIVTGLLPLSTAAWIAGSLHEQPNRRFWLAAMIGSSVVVLYALISGQGFIQLADLLLLVCIIFGGMGYAEGARLAQKRGGVFVMTWALVLMIPFLLVILLPQVKHITWNVSLKYWLAFGYLSLISQYGGMIIWYIALSRGSISRLSQVQLLQPFLTVLVAHIFFHETVSWLTYAAAAIVILCVLVARGSSVNLKKKEG